jgi:hypothetical protein
MPVAMGLAMARMRERRRCRQSGDQQTRRARKDEVAKDPTNRIERLHWRRPAENDAE